MEHDKNILRLNEGKIEEYLMHFSANLLSIYLITSILMIIIPQGGKDSSGYIFRHKMKVITYNVAQVQQWAGRQLTLSTRISLEFYFLSGWVELHTLLEIPRWLMNYLQIIAT